MSRNARLERQLGAVVADDRAIRPPDHLIDDILATTSRARPRPRWLALLKEPPMRIDSRVAIGSPAARLLVFVVLTLSLVLATAAAVVGAVSLVAGGPYVVAQDGSGTHDTIAAAVAAAEDGDTILVRPGVYPESVTITATLTIQGDGPREQIVIEASADGEMIDGLRYALRLEGSDTTLTGLTLRGEHSRVLITGGAPTLDGLLFEAVDRPITGSALYDGALIIRDSRATVRGSRFVGGGSIALMSSSAVIEDNELIDGPHIWLDEVDEGRGGGDPVIRRNIIRGGQVRGIGVYAVTTAVIEDNEIGDVPTGMDVGGSAGAGVAPTIRNNRITGVNRGIHTGDDASPHVLDNEISGALDAAIVLRTSGATIERNQLLDSTRGVLVGSGAAPTIIGNTIEGNDTGIQVGAGGIPIMTDNTLCDNGVHLSAGDPAITLDGNTVCAAPPSEAP